MINAVGGKMDDAVSCYLGVKDLIDQMGLPSAILINSVALRDDLIEHGIEPERLPLPESWHGTAETRESEAERTAT